MKHKNRTKNVQTEHTDSVIQMVHTNFTVHTKIIFIKTLSKQKHLYHTIQTVHYTNYLHIMFKQCVNK